ncbi:MAG: ParB N-terminal domain-containing protein, partial [Rhodospirillales bacterium]|nr:ParB N-terminal domain-containing protein [Rhodospirillales bacterium]
GYAARRQGVFDALDPVEQVLGQVSDRTGQLADAHMQNVPELQQPLSEQDMGSIAPWIAMQAARGAPYMALTAMGPGGMGAMGTALSGEIAQDRAAAQGRPDTVIPEDLLAGMAGAIPSAVLERIGARAVLGMGSRAPQVGGSAAEAAVDLATETGRRGATEALTEAVQEPTQYAAGTLGTEQGFDPAAALEAAAAGALVGGSVGTGLAVPSRLRERAAARVGQPDGGGELDLEQAIRDIQARLDEADRETARTRPDGVVELDPVVVEVPRPTRRETDDGEAQRTARGETVRPPAEEDGAAGAQEVGGTGTEGARAGGPARGGRPGRAQPVPGGAGRGNNDGGAVGDGTGTQPPARPGGELDGAPERAAGGRVPPETPPVVDADAGARGTGEAAPAAPGDAGVAEPGTGRGPEPAAVPVAAEGETDLPATVTIDGQVIPTRADNPDFRRLLEIRRNISSDENSSRGETDPVMKRLRVQEDRIADRIKETEGNVSRGTEPDTDGTPARDAAARPPEPAPAVPPAPEAEPGAGPVRPEPAAPPPAEPADQAPVPPREAGVAQTPPAVPEIKPRRSSDDPDEVAEATFSNSVVEGDAERAIGDLTGGVDMTQAVERNRVERLAERIRESGELSRLVVDTDGNVLEGQHRLEALRHLGVETVPVTEIRDLAGDLPLQDMQTAVRELGGVDQGQATIIAREVAAKIMNFEGGPAAAAQETPSFGDGRLADHYKRAFEVARDSIIGGTDGGQTPAPAPGGGPA